MAVVPAPQVLVTAYSVAVANTEWARSISSRTSSVGLGRHVLGRGRWPAGHRPRFKEAGGVPATRAEWGEGERRKRCSRAVAWLWCAVRLRRGVRHTRRRLSSPRPNRWSRRDRARYESRWRVGSGWVAGDSPLTSVPWSRRRCGFPKPPSVDLGSPDGGVLPRVI